MAICPSVSVFDSRRFSIDFLSVFIILVVSFPTKDCSPVQPKVLEPKGVGGSDNGPKNNTIQSSKLQLIASPLIPSHYKITVLLDVLPEQLEDNKLIQNLRQALADQLGLPVKNVAISSVRPEEGSVEFYFVYVMAKEVSSNGEGDLAVLLPANHVVRLLSTDKLNQVLSPVSVLEVTANRGPSQMTRREPSLNLGDSQEDLQLWSLFHQHVWASWQLPLLLLSSLFSVFAVVLLLLFLCYRRDLRKKTILPTVGSAPCLSPLVPGDIRQVVYQPVLKPAVTQADAIQPESRDSYLTETESEHTPSPVRSPLKIKPRGLLERRGSNASLTLDLNRSQENIHTCGPQKECSSIEILLSVGNRLTRKQLRNCLRDVKALHTEFWEIPMNHPEKLDIPGCGTKNRYRTILPNENTRVRLNNNGGDTLSSYINANYIRGYDGELKTYIATQGPMPHTVNDFWQMVWKERAPVIVMITKLKEKNKVKCESYLPAFSDSYAGIEVNTVKTVQRDGYTITELYLKRGEDAHQVLHFWYTSWPDHKTPSTAKQLVEMALEVEALRHDNTGATKGPTIVHCSAGIGRTGCFLATSIGIQQLLEENMVDILGIVCALRLDRGGMVQTAEQYEFVHQALCLFERTLLSAEGE